jgi:hypothetical protein
LNPKKTSLNNFKHINKEFFFRDIKNHSWVSWRVKFS